MVRSLSTALTALSAHATAVDIVGNNLANMNTPGFKASQVIFRDLMAQSTGVASAPAQVGLGASAPLTLRWNVQGAVQASPGPLAAAIQGEGFFVVRDSAGRTMYTRAGNFALDSSGGLLTASGEHVQGWNGVDATGPLGDITVPLGSLTSPNPTSSLSLDLNLDANAAAAATADKPYTFSTSVQVFDSRGAAHDLRLSFTTKGSGTGGNTTWSVSASVDGGAAVEIKEASLSFDGKGQLAPKTPGQTGPPATAPVYTSTFNIPVQDQSGGAKLGPITWEVVNSANTPRITQLAATSAVSATSQNGAPPSNIASVGVGDGGTVLAVFSNGSKVVVGQLALAQIANPETMYAAGNNNLQPTIETGVAAVGLPGTGGRGKVMGGSIESSTVDMAEEFTNLITYQRGYQANSRMITTSDELLQETLSLKR